MQHQLRLSLHATDMLIPTPPSTNWVVQTTEDGSEQYYYNTRTQEMRYSMPPEGIMEEKIKHALANSDSHDSLHESYNNLSPIMEQRQQQQHDVFEKPPVRPVRAANRVITEDFGDEYRSNSPIPTRAMLTVPTQQPKFIEEDEEFEDDEKVRDHYLT